MLEQLLTDSKEYLGANPLLEAMSVFSCELRLGLHYAWDGNRSKARDLLQASAILGHDTISQIEPDMTPEIACSVAEMSRDGAAAANLVDMEVLAQQLFAYAERFAAGMITGEEAHPAQPSLTIQPREYYSLIRSYSLVRLRRLDGFSAYIYQIPFPQAKRAAPAWQTSNIEQLLKTVDTSIAIGRARRESVVHGNAGKYLLPVLYTLSESLRTPASVVAQITAQVALEKYYSMIRNLYDFPIIYLLVLDLQKAFPEIYRPVITQVP